MGGYRGLCRVGRGDVSRVKKQASCSGLPARLLSVKTFVTCDICLDITYITACLNIRQKGIISWRTRLTSKNNKKKNIISGSASNNISCMIQKICSG